MKHKTWYYAIAVLLALALALAWAFAPRAVEVETAPVTQGRFEITVDEDAKTRLADRYVVSAPLAGRLSRITLREGDAVAAGATLALLAPVLPAMLDVRTQRELAARVEAAQANIERAGTRIARAEVALAQANNEVARSEKLAQQGFVAATKLDTDRLGVLAAQKEVDAAVAERHVATHDLEQARAALGAVRQSEGSAVRQPEGSAVRPSEGTPPRSFALRAPVAGQVLRVLQGSEATVALGTALLELGDIGRLEVVAELLTNDAIAAVPGSRVLIERWGGPGTLEGRVKRVEPGGFTKVSALGVEEQRVRVLIDITSPAPQWKALGDGFRVSVRIVTLAQDNALLVPVSAVFPLPTTTGKAATAAPSAPASPAMPATAAPAMPGTTPPAAPLGAADNGAGSGGNAVPHHAVFVAEGGRARLRPVVLRGRNGHMAWLNGTLPAGTQVIVYPPPAVSDGVRIAARKV